MKRINRKEDEEGAMGVGTLIVFIAMVLVAAVAASVLIDTANKLQQQAEKTGDQAIREVSTAFVVKDVYGYNGEDNTIENLSLKVGLAAGAAEQNLNQTVIQISGQDSEANLLAAPSLGTGTQDGNSYSVVSIIEQEDSADMYLEQGDIVNVTIDLANTVGSAGTQEDLSINIIPKHGTPTYEEVVTPPVINTKIVDLT